MFKTEVEVMKTELVIREVVVRCSFCNSVCGRGKTEHDAIENAKNSGIKPITLSVKFGDEAFTQPLVLSICRICVKMGLEIRLSDEIGLTSLERNRR